MTKRPTRSANLWSRPVGLYGPSHKNIQTLQTFDHNHSKEEWQSHINKCTLQKSMLSAVQSCLRQLVFSLVGLIL